MHELSVGHVSGALGVILVFSVSLDQLARISPQVRTRSRKLNITTWESQRQKNWC